MNILGSRLPVDRPEEENRVPHSSVQTLFKAVYFRFFVVGVWGYANKQTNTWQTTKKPWNTTIDQMEAWAQGHTGEVSWGYTWCFVSCGCDGRLRHTGQHEPLGVSGFRHAAGGHFSTKHVTWAPWRRHTQEQLSWKHHRAGNSFWNEIFTYSSVFQKLLVL